jgi:gamma-glutamylcyclotransferase (GGCT)/AIG2-like uncharacterized protein YtfP
VADESVFAYGTLAIDSVMETLLGRIPPSEPGVLRGYRSAKLRDHVFPAVVADAASTTSGRIYAHLTEDEIALFDAFEWSAYQRVTEPVQAANGQTRICSVYALPPEKQNELSEMAWDQQGFVERDLTSYLRRCREWLEDYRQRASS